MLGLASVLAAAAWLATGFYQVENGSSAVLLRFGAVIREDIEPGLHFRLPNGIDRDVVFASGEVRRLEVTGDNETKMDVITGDENLIATSLVVQYKVTDGAGYLFASDDPRALIVHAVQSALLEVAGTMLVDDLLTTGKARIQNDVRSRAQELLRRYGAGVSILAVTLQSIEPPTEAAAAFRAVQDSRSESARTITDSRMLADHMLSLTRAEAARMLEEARSQADARLYEAEGAASRFRALLARYRQAPAQTKQDLLEGRLAEILPRTETLVLAPGDRPRLDLHLQRDRSR